jgi:hypothetical protein
MIRPLAQRSFWAPALGGLALGVVGAGWDRVWHSHNLGTMLGLGEVIEAHWLMFLSVAIIFVAFASAVRFSRVRSGLAGAWIGFAGSLCMVIGFAWDSARHAQAADSPVAHGLIYAGLLTVLIGLSTMLMANRKRTDAS